MPDNVTPVPAAPVKPVAPAVNPTPAPKPVAPAAPADDPHPGSGFVRIRWKEKIGGTEADEEWCEERRAHNLESTGHAEILKDEKAK